MSYWSKGRQVIMADQMGRFVDYLRALYGGQEPDLIIVVGAPAAGFIQRHRKDLFATAPMVFTTVEQRRVQTSALTERDTLVAVIHDFRFLFESFLRIAPDTKTVAIINGALTLSGGTVTGAGAITLNSASNTWSGGTFAGTGTLTIAPAAPTKGSSQLA